MGLIKKIEFDSSEEKLEALKRFQEDYNLRLKVGKIRLGLCIKYRPPKESEFAPLGYTLLGCAILRHA